MKRANKQQRSLKTFLGRVVRDIERKVAGSVKLPSVFSEPLSLAPRIQKVMAEQTPLKRLALPIDIAKGVLFYATDLSDFVTGNCLSVDGGKTMR